MPRSKTKREVRIGVNITSAVDSRLAELAGVAGQSPSVLASLALVIGLRVLEQTILGIDPRTIAAASEHLKGDVEHDVDALAGAVEKPKPDDRRLGFKADASMVEDELPAWVPTRGYMAGL